MIDPGSVHMGNGTYGCVFRGADNGVYKKIEHQWLAHVIREVVCLRGLTHPNVLKGYECTYDEQHLKIRMKEFSGDLFHWLRDDRSAHITIRSVPFFMRMLYGLCAGIYHIHSCGLVHADIKPHNILMNRITGDIAYCDFNFSYIVTDCLQPALVQTPNYRAPEIDVTMGIQTYTKKIDIWSIGALIYWIATAQQLLSNKVPNDTTAELCEFLGVDPSGTRKRRLRRLYSINMNRMKDIIHSKLARHCVLIVPGKQKRRFISQLSKLIAGCLIPNVDIRIDYKKLYSRFMTLARVIHGDSASVMYKPEGSHAYYRYDTDIIPCALCDSLMIIGEWPACAQHAFSRLFEHACNVVTDAETTAYDIKKIGNTVVPVLNIENIQKGCMYIVCSVYMSDHGILDIVPDVDMRLVVLQLLELMKFNILHILI